jgi:hypothetical protein
MPHPIKARMTRLVRLAAAACACLCLPGCYFDEHLWRVSNKTAVFAAIAAACVVIVVASKRFCERAL